MPDPQTVQHDPSEACGDQHCYTHHVDEPSEPAYRFCYECGHVWRTAAELLAEHNRQLAVYGRPPETDVNQVFCCPLCIHDW